MEKEIRIREKGRSFNEVGELMRLNPVTVYMQQRRFKKRETALDSNGHKVKFATVLLYRFLAHLPDDYVEFFTNDDNFEDRGMYMKEK